MLGSCGGSREGAGAWKGLESARGGSGSPAPAKNIVGVDMTFLWISLL